METQRTKELDWGRQLELIPPEKLQFPVIIIGAGGIGSPCAVALAKMGCGNLTIWDFDIVEEHNIANQFYPVEAVGQPKVEALSAVVESFGGVRPQAVPKAFTAEERASGVVCACVDTLEARKQIWEAVRYKPAVSLYIDGRLGAETGIVYTIRPCDIEGVRFYEQTLHPDEESLEAPCTARATIYSPLFMAALIANQVKKYALEEALCREIIFDLKNLTLLTAR